MEVGMGRQGVDDYRRTQSRIVFVWPTGTDLSGPGTKGTLLDSAGILDVPFRS